jgi:hypothetical protein
MKTKGMARKSSVGVSDTSEDDNSTSAWTAHSSSLIMYYEGMVNTK